MSDTSIPHSSAPQGPRPELTLADLTEIGVERLKGVGDKKLKGLHKSDVRNLFDLITHYPRRYIDRTNERRIDQLIVGEEANVFVRVVSTSSRRIKGGRTMVNIMVTDGTGNMELTFFNQAWRERQLNEGSEAVVFGKVGDFRGKRQMANPVVDLVGNKTGKIIPVYPQSDKAGLTSWDYVQFLAEAVRRTIPPTGRGIVDPLPDWVLDRFDFVDRNAAIQGIHAPDSLEEAAAAKRRLIFEELFRMQLSLVLRKRALEATEQGLEHRVDGPLLDRFRGTLPFALTGAQERAIGEIASDLVRPTPMHRLLQGDVGSGKTLVAVASMLAAVDGGHQAALMAPTEVLAEQHHAGIRRLLDGLTVPEPGSLLGERPLKVELLANRVSTPERKRILSELLLGTTDLIIGTHALIQDSVMFSSLGVVVIDEQHRFGVEQRAALRAKTATDALPDVLVMTATPIPRTAAMTVYGDLDVSVLDELPPGRTPIQTHWIPAAGSLEGEEVPLELEAMWQDVRASVAEGRQIYVVCPLIDESEKLEVASAETIAERLHLVELAGLSLGLLHGRQKSEDKDATMEAFRAGELDVLVATTVIEVGVDVPNATGMVILDADRFGIAQLHQLRGRVGRGQHASTCWLVGEPSTPDGEARLEALVASTDGFELAEVDLDLRGEGTILGERQKGQNDLKLASLRTDRAVVEAARHTAIELLDADPGLAKHPGLATELELFLDPEEAEFLLKG